jgi:segregation and condensation protein B
MTENYIENENQGILGRIEALLFVASGPVTASQIGEALAVPTKVIETAMDQLRADLTARRGMSLQFHGGRYQLTTAPEHAEDIEKFLGIEATSRLSRASIETMAIIAYRQPITRPGIEAIRGVSSDGVIRSLLSKGLIQEVGRAEGPGRPILFSTTSDFLQHFGLNSLEQLPPYEIDNGENEKAKTTLLKD